jgi:hypothetical protein
MNAMEIKRNMTISLLMVFMILMAVCTGAAMSETTGWFMPSAVKVLHSAKPAVTLDQKWTLAAARNEVESCQLVLLSDAKVTGVTVTAASLLHSNGKAKLTPTLLKVMYVPIWPEVPEPSPDPMPPLTGAFDLEPG